MASGLRSHFLQSFLFFWPGRRPPVALDVLKMKSVKWWKLKNNEIIKSCPRSYLRVCLLAHVAMLKWRHWGWILGGWFGGPPCTSRWVDGSLVGWVVMETSTSRQIYTHTRPGTEWAVLILPFTLCHNARSCLMSFHFVFDSKLLLFFWFPVVFVFVSARNCMSCLQFSSCCAKECLHCFIW